MSRARRSAVVLVALCLSAALAACAGERTSTTAASSVTASSASATTTWLAVLRVERQPDALDADTQALTDVLGGSLVVSPASCLRGLPPDVDPSSYVLGVVAPDRTALDELVARTDREPVFRVEVEVLCTD